MTVADEINKDIHNIAYICKKLEVSFPIVFQDIVLLNSNLNVIVKK